jgi:hypothetical protein
MCRYSTIATITFPQKLRAENFQLSRFTLSPYAKALPRNCPGAAQVGMDDDLKALDAFECILNDPWQTGPPETNCRELARLRCATRLRDKIL